MFSACSRRQLRAFFRKGGGACLSNAPDSGLLVRPAHCGNSFVEEGEECDCGAGQVRSARPAPGGQGWPPPPAGPKVRRAAPSPGPSLPFRLQECPDTCCSAHNCSLRAGAQCSQGDCCARCLVRAWKLVGEGRGALGASLLVLASQHPSVLTGCWICSVLASTWLSRCALPPLSLALCVDLSLFIFSLCLGHLPVTRVTCVAEVGGRALPPGCW